MVLLMANTSIYDDIATRTGGDIYIGVVGPVRTGKSTFIKKFMENLVLPNISDDYDRERAKDGMPQSAAGRTVMTTEPKFIPDEAVGISVDGGAKLSVKMIDCVGYLIDGALGQSEDGQARMVTTPWSSEPMPFEAAAEIGTRKVISDHATIGVLVTTDGSITDIPRTAYEDAERQVASELSALGKPYVLLLNSAHPEYPETQALGHELESRYNVPVALINATELDGEDIRQILELVLLEFPIVEVKIDLPEWMSALDDNHRLIGQVTDRVMTALGKIKQIGELKDATKAIVTKDFLKDAGDDPKDDPFVSAEPSSIDLGSGCARIKIITRPSLYYEVLSELCGIGIKDQTELIDTLCELAAVKEKFDRVENALCDVEEKGYGIVMPRLSDMTLEEPKIVRHSGGYGVLLKASAPAIHMMRATVNTEISPVVGTEQQSEDLVRYLLDETKGDPDRIWSTNLFGRSLEELVGDGLASKLDALSDDARAKLAETVSRVINEGSSGLICIIL